MRSLSNLPPAILVLILMLACKQLNFHQLQYEYFTFLSYVNVNSEDPCSAGYEGIFMVYFRTEFNTPSSIDLLNVVTKDKAK